MHVSDACLRFVSASSSCTCAPSPDASLLSPLALFQVQGEACLALGHRDEAERLLTRCVRHTVDESKCNWLTASALPSLAAAVGPAAPKEAGGSGEGEAGDDGEGDNPGTSSHMNPPTRTHACAVVAPISAVRFLQSTYRLLLRICSEHAPILSSHTHLPSPRLSHHLTSPITSPILSSHTHLPPPPIASPLPSPHLSHRFTSHHLTSHHRTSHHLTSPITSPPTASPPKRVRRRSACGQKAAC